MGIGRWISALLTGPITLDEFRCFIRDGADPGVPLSFTSEFQPDVRIDGNVGVDLHSEIGETTIVLSLVERPDRPQLCPQVLIDYLEEAIRQHGHWRDVSLRFNFYRWKNNRGWPPDDEYSTTKDWRPVFDENETNLVIVKGLVRTGEEFDKMYNMVPMAF